METHCAATISAVPVTPRIQARKFHHPAKKPHTLPYGPAVTEAQLYTNHMLELWDLVTAVYTPPPDEGIAEASSAIEAAISQ